MISHGKVRRKGQEINFVSCAPRNDNFRIWCLEQQFLGPFHTKRNGWRSENDAGKVKRDSPWTSPKKKCATSKFTSNPPAPQNRARVPESLPLIFVGANVSCFLPDQRRLQLRSSERKNKRKA
jgi:hypothetical protein